MKVRFLGHPILGDCYNSPYGLRMKAGDVADVSESEGKRLLVTFPMAFEVVGKSRKVDAAPADRMVRAPKNKRGRKKT